METADGRSRQTGHEADQSEISDSWKTNVATTSMENFQPPKSAQGSRWGVDSNERRANRWSGKTVENPRVKQSRMRDGYGDGPKRGSFHPSDSDPEIR
jgi:hypothetical protein